MESLKSKVALVTGAANGIGLAVVVELLRNGVKGVTLVDINAERGKEVVKNLGEEFDHDRFLFVQVNVVNKKEVEDAFEKTIEKFSNLDLVVSNAGILDDHQYEKQIAINVNGALNVTLLAFDEYLPKYKSGNTAMIINTSSIAALEPNTSFPVYSMTKGALLQLGLALGVPGHFERTSVLLVTICPGSTATTLVSDVTKQVYHPSYLKLLEKNVKTIFQTTETVAKNLIQIIKQASNGSVWVIEESEAYEVDIPKRSELKIKSKIDLSSS